jgi:hypothetical protein
MSKMVQRVKEFFAPAEAAPAPALFESEQPPVESVVVITTTETIEELPPEGGPH